MRVKKLKPSTASLYLFLAIVPAFCSLPLQAGTMAQSCQSANKTSQTQAVIARLNCYLEKMQGILQDRKDIQTLAATVSKIRGPKKTGTEKQYYCGFQAGTQKVKFLVGKGLCSTHWNNWISQRNKYLNLTCHIGLGDLDDDVKNALELSRKYLSQYKVCFSEKIPQQIRDEFAIEDRESFRDNLAKKQKQYIEQNKPAEFHELAKACNKLLNQLANTKPALIEQYNLRCQ